MPNSSNQEEENRLKMLDRDGKMFKVLGEDITSVNPYNGCGYNCYDGGCWAKNFAENHPEWAGYGDGFEPSFVEKRIDSSNTRGKIRNNDYIWLGIMGDFAFQSTEVMERIINEVVRPYEENMFLLATKNPDSFNRLIDDLPENVMVSTTIETNRGYDYGEEYNVSNAPGPGQRYNDFRDLDWSRKHVSIEPYMDFDLDVIVEWMEEIGAEIVSIGPDSGGNELPEPTTEEVYQLLKELAEFTRVEPKKNLVERMSRELDDFQGLDTDEVYAELKDRGYLPDAVFE